MLPWSHPSSIRNWPPPGRAGRLARWLLAAVLAATLGVSAADSPISKEYQVKAVFLFNFPQFVEWPATAFPQADSPLVIGILGDDPFGAFMDATVRGETVNGHPFVIQRYRKVEDIEACHVLFISASETSRLEKIYAALKGRSILTVGDVDGFARRGGMIRFALEQGKVRLHINLETARAAGLTISSKLLRPAQIVGPGGD